MTSAYARYKANEQKTAEKKPRAVKLTRAEGLVATLAAAMTDIRTGPGDLNGTGE